MSLLSLSTETFLAVTRQGPDHTKNLVLDLLGWGVSPEYLVKAGVSAGVSYRVFTDPNFRLPTNLVLPSTRPLTPSGIRYELHEFRSTDFVLARLTFVCAVATGMFHYFYPCYHAMTCFTASF
jgi:hypothetical protein